MSSARDVFASHQQKASSSSDVVLAMAQSTVCTWPHPSKPLSPPLSPYDATSNFGLYFAAAFPNSPFFSFQSLTARCPPSTFASLAFNSSVSFTFPNNVFSTTRFASVSADSPSIAIACSSAASASGKRPRCSSDTACATRECGDWDWLVCASSSKT